MIKLTRQQRKELKGNISRYNQFKPFSCDILNNPNKVVLYMKNKNIYIQEISNLIVQGRDIY